MKTLPKIKQSPTKSNGGFWWDLAQICFGKKEEERKKLKPWEHKDGQGYY